MDWRDAHFLGSWPNPQLLPKPRLAEVALVGRSNVGKSSLINALCYAPKLAKVSATPGKTQELVFFEVSRQLHLVDLPGYGYAKASHTMKRSWEVIEEYLKERAAGCVLLIDIRHGPMPSDLEFLQWLQHHQISHELVLTKADKLSRSAALAMSARVEQQLQRAIWTVSERDPTSLEAVRRHLFEPYHIHLPFRRLK